MQCEIFIDFKLKNNCSNPVGALLSLFTEDLDMTENRQQPPTKSIPALSLVPRTFHESRWHMPLINGAVRLKLAIVSTHEFTKGSVMPLPDISL